eukprot:CAMPEP_0177769820 /NCGR_PEP_ID=MMETSP0491_2-20121128/10558_1 /TAXON_ID=63592 /ORGANISM="Tetraselmis chuii, Strain PLY429" /LENGTH=35 /DNA_ID= /DNA_START= /DNA_END= /DNA_ORIENTATION=
MALRHVTRRLVASAIPAPGAAPPLGYSDTVTGFAA